MTPATAAAGVILAGGASTRMGTDKALVEVGGVAMVERVGAVLEQTVPGAVVVQGRSGTLGGYPCRSDDVPGGGPLAGVVTALGYHPPGSPLVVVGVDHPFVRTETLQGLLTHAAPGRAVVAVVDGIRQVTVAVYDAGLVAAARRALAEGGSLQTLHDAVDSRLVDEAEWRAWGEDGRSWFSVDSPEDVHAGWARFGR